jgi:hypothetical protein
VHAEGKIGKLGVVHEEGKTGKLEEENASRDQHAVFSKGLA